MSELQPFLPYIASILALVIGFVLYRRTGFQGKVRTFVNKKGLKTKSKRAPISPEILRQVFIQDFPDYKQKNTDQFISALRVYLNYKDKDEEHENGLFYINPECEYASPPEPTKEMPPLPEGFIEF